MHPLPPHLSATLIGQRRTSCPCGARTTRPGTFCRKCHHTALWLRHTRQAKHATRTARRMATHRAPVLLAVVAALIKGRR
jgi:ribosomal protein L40E